LVRVLISKDAAFCLYCYLLFEPTNPKKFRSDVFAKSRYNNWKEAITILLKCEDFMNQRTSVS